MTRRPNVLVILTDQLHYPPPYESDELAEYRREHLPGVERLRQNGVSFRHHYPMSAACAPSRTSLLTGQYPSLHGVTQTDGIAKSADGDDMFWLAPDSVPTLGDWFRAGGYRTYYKGKWHVSHPYLDAEDGDGYLLSIDDDGTPIEDNIQKYLDADLLDDHGFSEWVGPDPHGLGKHNTGVIKDPFTADETIALLKRLDADAADAPWLTVCSFLNPHDDSLFGAHRAHAGAALPPLTGAACRSGPDARGGSLDEALLPAELRRQLGQHPRAAAVERDPPEVLLPDAGRGRPADHACPRRPARDRGLREHDRDLQLRSRRHAGRPRRDAREVARRLRGGASTCR